MDFWFFSTRDKGSYRACWPLSQKVYAYYPHWLSLLPNRKPRIPCLVGTLEERHCCRTWTLTHLVLLGVMHLWLIWEGALLPPTYDKDSQPPIAGTADALPRKRTFHRTSLCVIHHQRCNSAGSLRRSCRKCSKSLQLNFDRPYSKWPESNNAEEDRDIQRWWWPHLWPRSRSPQIDYLWTSDCQGKE